MHCSILDRLVDVEQFPFELTESGWGEFEIEMRLEFVDPSLEPVSFGHLLKLHSLNGEPNKEGVVCLFISPCNP